MSDNNLKDIRFCPSCGGMKFYRSHTKQWQCKLCDFIFFQNSAAAVAAIIRYRDKILMTVRKSNPGKGMLDLPGGFVDYGESLEEALTREINEELNYHAETWEYLFSYPNRYIYKGIVYRTTDAFFKIEPADQPDVTPCDDVSGIVWMPLDDIELDAIALSSIRKAVARLRAIEVA